MTLESEIAGGVAGRSTTNFTHDNRVNDQNSHRHDHAENYQVKEFKMYRGRNDDNGLSDQSDQCQTDDDFLRSACCA